MSTLTLQEYKDKVMGCWAGKNIGGVLGAPFEGKRQVNQASFYVQDLTQGPPPNDDLDLQIVWLAAVEAYGRQVNASILGDYWLTFISPDWVEYGTGKSNLRAGFQPPLSGLIDNTYKDSNGAWIRSEIWACLAPGHPEIAARYAYEDASVDHAHEGVYSEVFTAALQSAAFAESSKDKLIRTALSYIPRDCAVAKAVQKAIWCYQNQVPFLEARKEVHHVTPGTFGVQGRTVQEASQQEKDGLEIGIPGFDAPENVAFMILGWLYGGDDFGKSLVMVNSLGEDTDCTCGTLAATMGIIQGASRIPKEWSAPLNDTIATFCIKRINGGIWVPGTVTELTERVIRDLPGFLGPEVCNILDPDGSFVTMREGDELLCESSSDFLPLINDSMRAENLPVREICEKGPYVVRSSCPVCDILLDYGETIHFHTGEEIRLKVTVLPNRRFREQKWAKITLYAPPEVTAQGGFSKELPLNNLHGSKAETEFVLNADAFPLARLEGVIEVSVEGRHSYGCVPYLLTRA